MAKVLQLVTQMEAGGAQRVAVLLSRGLSGKGHCASLGFLYRKREAFGGEPNIEIIARRPEGALSLLRMLAALAAKLLRERPDAIITHTHWANIVGSVVGRACGVKRRIAVQHGLAADFPGKAKLMDLLLGATGFYTANVCVSNSVRSSVDGYPSAYRKRISVIYNGIPEPVADAEHSAVRNRYGIPPDAALLVNVGRLAHVKNQSSIVEALRDLDGVHLLLVGDGELRYELGEKVRQTGTADRVHFTGEIANEEVRRLIAAADVFVFPSRSEGMSLSLMEVMHIGKPVVASGIAPNVELLDDAALFVAPEDPRDLREKIKKVLEDPRLRSELARRSKERARTFSVDRMVESYEILFR